MDLGRLTSSMLDKQVETTELASRGERSVLSAEQIEQVYRYGQFVGSSLEYHQQVGRTMVRARQKIEEAVSQHVSFASGKVILAGSLSEPKGRFQRTWHAPEGGLWGSFIHVGSLFDRSRSLLPLAAGVACCEALRSFGAEGAVIRWVNDILVNGRKIAGFLAESLVDQVYGEQYDIVGFGINLNNRSFPLYLKDDACSLVEVTGQNVSLEDFCCCFLAKLRWSVGLVYFEEQYRLDHQQFAGKDGKHLLVEEWKKLSDTIGRAVVFGFNVIDAPEYTAEVLDIKNDGGLVLALPDGSTAVEYSGELRYCTA